MFSDGNLSTKIMWFENLALYIYLYIYIVFPRKDVAATIYFSSTTMRRLFEGGYYSKYRRRGYYLFQRYHNSATIRGRLLFEVQMSQLLFISVLPQCGDYSRAATIRSTDVAATIYFSSTAMRRLFEGGYYSRAATIQSTDVAATIYFSSTAMRRLFEGGYYSKYRRRGYYLFQLYRNAATIRGRLLFEVQTSWLLFISALPQCGDYSRAATIRSTDVAATIYFSSTAMRRLFEGGYYSKYRRRGYYLFQLYRNAATIRGRLLFEVQTSWLLFISALPQCGDYSRAATIRGAVFIRGNTVYIYYIYCLRLIFLWMIVTTNIAKISSVQKFPLCITVQYSTVQYSTVRYSTVQYGAVQCSAVN